MQENKFYKNTPHLGESIPETALSGEDIIKKTDKNIRNELVDELFEELTSAQILYSSIDKLLKIKLDKVHKNYNFNPCKNEEKINQKIIEIIKLLLKHASLVGKAQAIIDLQRGLTLLNKNNRRSVVEAKRPLLNDGIYGNKTYNCLCGVCRHYSLNIIKNYIKKGIINNIIFDTKNKSKLDTMKLIEKVCLNLESEK